MKTHKKLAIVKDGKISGQSNFNYIHVLLYNRILSARLKGLKKEMLLKNRQQIKKKVYIQLNFAR